jgi:hypothetical protein
MGRADSISNALHSLRQTNKLLIEIVSVITSALSRATSKVLVSVVACMDCQYLMSCVYDVLSFCGGDASETAQFVLYNSRLDDRRLARQSLNVNSTAEAILRSQRDLCPDKEMYTIFLREMQLETTHFSFTLAVVQQWVTMCDF